MSAEFKTMRERLESAVLVIRRQQARIAELEAAGAQPIAIVGIGCRFPGGADSPQAFWRLLRDGVDAVGEVPAERWDVDAFYDENRDAPGKMYTRNGAFLERLDQFDPAFFGISPREAEQLDPQQRLLLEVAWETLEDAALPPHLLRGSRTGVFVGSMSNDYAAETLVAGAAERISPYTGTGAAGSFLAGRLSYQFGWQGPSIPVDAACASSLVAVHLACASLRNRECDLALAGGVNAILSPRMSVLISRLGALSADGRCKTFDASADGFGRGEGCGLVALKRLGDAQAEGDRILAIVRGSAVNHNGSSSGLTVPNPLAQQAVIRQALASARVAPEAVGYVEAHGTGTILGDPAELRALWAVLGKDAPRDRELIVGSVKTNIGHTEGAAGIAGLIKVVLVLNHGEIPPHLHLQRLNPHIVDDRLPIRIPVERQPWPTGAQQRLAGVSSFGLSGINAHVVVGEAPPRDAATEPGSDVHTVHRLRLSARTPAALRELASRYAAWITEHAEVALADICYTAEIGRTPFEERLTVAAHTREDAVRMLTAFAAGESPAGVTASAAGAAKDGARAERGRGRKVALPTYPFQRQRYWHGARSEPCAADFLRDPGEVIAELTRAVAPTGDPGNGDIAEAMTQIEALALDYLVSGLARLGWRPARGESITPDALAASLGMLPRYGRLLRRALDILAEEGIVCRAGTSWVAQASLAATDSTARREQVAARFPRATVELTLLERCGSRLPEILRGELDPLGLIFTTDGSSGAVELYHESLPLEILNRLCGETLALAARDLPAGRALRVLEIGAGTGGTTRHLLSALSAHSARLCFTDISAAFFAKARERFAAYPFIEYRALNIEVDPARQGFSPHSFDVVVAANVLHATRDLPQTLRHVRRLLAPRGLLLLFEGVTRRRSLDLTFGLLEGWWRFDDAVRKDYPMLDLEQWGDLLEEEGFDPPSSLAPTEVQASAAVILARGPHVASAGAAGPPATEGARAEPAAFRAPFDGAAAGLRDRFNSASAAERERIVTEFLQTEVSRLLGLTAEVLPPVGQELFSLGFDSLMALDLSQRVSAALPLERPFEPAIVFERPTIAALAAHLLDLAPGAAAPSARAAGRDWSAEAVLDAAIAAPSGDVSPWAESRAPFLTGATGFLGAVLLHELLQQAQTNVYCLVRCKDGAEGLERLCRNLQTYGLFEPSYRSRIVALPGNLTEPLLGLPEPSFDRLAASIDAIYHNGAAVNFLYGYDALRASNVLGTQEVLRLACRQGIRPVHYVSTLYVLHIFDGVLLESDVPQRIDGLATFDGIPFAVGYAQSKAIAEQLVREAGRRGVPVTIYRPGFLAGVSTSGAWSVRDFPARLIKAWVELGLATPARLNLTPADFVGRAVVKLSRHQASRGRTFHLASPRSVSGYEIAEMFRAIGVPLRVVPYEEWRRALIARLGGEPDPALHALLEMLPSRQPPVMDTAMQVDCRDALAGLKGSGITCPAIDTALMRRYLRSFASSGFIDMAC